MWGNSLKFAKIEISQHMNYKKHILAFAALLFMTASCSNSSGKQATAPDGMATDKTIEPQVVFDADSAYSYVAAQCAFGERVPNTDAHRRCGDYLAGELRRHGATVTEQHATLTAFDGTKIEARNIIGEYYPDKRQRILLLAHWDCRPWADNDPDAGKRQQPVMGANDGASGVGVLLEIARILSRNEPEMGIDILLTDAEDWGNSGASDDSSWALGTQHWVDNPHRNGYQYPSFGILLDMVGDRNAKFLKEYFSVQSASGVVGKLWTTAAKLGYDNYFIDTRGGAMTDDHVFLIRAGIPCVDIIDQRMDNDTGFCPQWHTSFDTMKHIDRSTLKAVGQTVTTMLFGK